MPLLPGHWSALLPDSAAMQSCTSPPKGLSPQLSPTVALQCADLHVPTTLPGPRPFLSIPTHTHSPLHQHLQWSTMTYMSVSLFTPFSTPGMPFSPHKQILCVFQTVSSSPLTTSFSWAKIYLIYINLVLNYSILICVSICLLNENLIFQIKLETSCAYRPSNASRISYRVHHHWITQTGDPLALLDFNGISTAVSSFWNKLRTCSEGAYRSSTDHIRNSLKPLIITTNHVCHAPDPLQGQNIINAAWNLLLYPFYRRENWEVKWFSSGDRGGRLLPSTGIRLLQK